MICFDTQILIWGIQGASRPDQSNMVGRTQRYIDQLDRDGERVMIPAPALAEYLAGFDVDGQERQLQILERSFLIPSLDAPAAALAARILAQRELIRDLSRDHNVRRQELKVDVLIVATAIVHQADTLVSEDPHIRQLVAASGRTIKVIGVPDVSSPGPLFGSPATN